MKLQTRVATQRIVNVILVVLLCCVALAFFFPLIWLLDSTFRPAIEIFNVPPQIVQRGFESFSSYSLDNLVAAVSKYGALLAFLNSTYVVISGIALMLLICSLAAYAFSFLQFPLKRILFMFVLGTMMVPATTMIVPFYKIMIFLGLIDSPLGLIIPYAASAYGLFLLRQYLIKIPISFVESAKMDGANDFRIHFSIILPLARPAIAALSIIQFRAIWNDFMLPLIILKTKQLYTLPLQIQVMDSINIAKISEFTCPVTILSENWSMI